MSMVSMMRNCTLGLLGLALLAGAFTAGAATRFVNASNAAAAWPYTSWASAATRIQDAVDVAVTGELILVTNGVYETGGKAASGYSLTNRVAVTKAVTVRSVNGPGVTIIRGYQDPTGPNGDLAVRCVYLAGGAWLSGFTLTNGATRGAAGDWSKEQGGGGVWCESATAMVSNCVVTGNSAYDHGAGAVGGTLSRCLLTNNAAVDTVVARGGGAYSAVLKDCTVADNASLYGGGAYDCTLANCTLAGNGAANWGGGAYESTLNNCTLTGNSASAGGGGGTYWCILTNCTLKGNWVQGGDGGGGGDYGSTLNNCVLSGNYADACDGGGAALADLKNCALTGNQANRGGGSYYCTLNNCTLSGNGASFEGGGDYGGRLTNCIIYYNSTYNPGSSNWSGSAASYCCTFPRPSGGAGNLTNAPVFVNLAGGDLHLLPGSPCINAGLNAAAPGPVDLDGYPRIVGGTVDLGAYEWPARPQFVGWQPPGPGGMTLYLVGETGRVVEIHASSNLAQWFWLATRTNTTGQVVYTDTGATNQPRRCYRAIQLP